jgi:hypothetical protein
LRLDAAFAVKLWDLATVKELATLQGHEGMVYSGAIWPVPGKSDEFVVLVLA